jgi:hypothetical protein
MSGLLRQNTPVTVMIGEFLDDTDGKTAEGGLTLTNSDIYLSKNGEAYAGKHESSSATSDVSLVGWYACPLDGTDTSASGILQLAVHVSGALPVWHSWMVVPANVYDSAVSGTDLLNVNADDLLNTIVDGSYDLQTILQVLAAVLAGKVSGGGTSTITFRDLADSLDRLVASVDSNGNRSNVAIT